MVKNNLAMQDRMKASHLPNPVPHQFTFYHEVTEGLCPGIAKEGAMFSPPLPPALEKPSRMPAPVAQA